MNEKEKQFITKALLGQPVTAHEAAAFLLFCKDESLAVTIFDGVCL